MPNKFEEKIAYLCIVLGAVGVLANIVFLLK